MAQGSRSMAGPHDLGGGLIVGQGRNNTAPNSTLSAQLVEHISTATGSYRSDENKELRGLCSVIQRVEDDPSLLKTVEEKVDHNHMLIYVYCRAILDNIKLDDPFLDKNYARAEAFKAINFFRYTINETPVVLTYVTVKHDLVSRGQYPLWVWLLPQLLRMLGHAKCDEIEGALEGFLQYFLLVIARNGRLWKIAGPVCLFLRSCFTGLLEHAQSPLLTPSTMDLVSSIELPPSNIINILRLNSSHATPTPSYKVTSITHALRQAASLAKVLSYPSLCSDQAFASILPMPENESWLVDAWLDLRSVQQRWDITLKSSPLPVIELAIDVLNSSCESRKPYESARNKIATALVLLCGELVTNPEALVLDGADGDSIRSVLCVAIVKIIKASLRSQPISRLAASKVVQELALLSLQYAPVGEESDVWRCNLLLSHVTHSEPTTVFSALTHPLMYQSDRVRHEIEQLKLTHESPKLEINTHKRQKLETTETTETIETTALQLVFAEIYATLGVGSTSRSSLTEQSVFDRLGSASESDFCIAVDLISKVSCIADGGVIRDRENYGLYCQLCETGHRCYNDTTTIDGVKEVVRSIFSRLVTQNYFLEGKRSRIVAMMALKRVVLHCEASACLNLEASILGRWCLRSLNSSIRELRIASGRTLSCFIPAIATATFGEDLINHNKKYLIAFLKSASEGDQRHMVETRVMAWGQVGRIVNDEVLNLVLIKLLDYLGSSNNIEAAVAFNELLGLAEVQRTTPRRLLEPFWKSLAYMATKDMVQRPQRSRAIAELLQISIEELLLLIQHHALPWLVLDGRKEVIQKIAEARRDSDIWCPIVDSANLAAVLSLLMIQDSDDTESFTKSRLNAISLHFEPFSLLDLIETEQATLATELLRASAEADSERKRTVYKALRWMATAVLNKSKETKSKKGNPVGRFLQPHVLGLMARLADVINNPTSIHPIAMEQRLCIQTLQEMIDVCQSHARVARPQISACLLSAFAHDPLREAAFSCWTSMLMKFDKEDVEAILETTFFVINRYWSKLTTPSKRCAKETLTFLIEKHETILKKNISKLPSFSHISALEPIEAQLKVLRPKLAFEEALNVFALRINHDDSGVVYQALAELVPYLRVNQHALHASIVGKQADSPTLRLLRGLLDCASKYNYTHTDLNRLCVESIGLIGCLDSNQIETVREQRTIVVLDNFEGSQEMTDFSLFLIEEVLVPSFLSATDSRLQGFLCFAMQELLDRCEVKAAVGLQNTGILGGNDIYRKWIALPEAIREVIAPFLTSRYIVAPMAPVRVEFPIFHAGKPYGNWLRAFVIDLLRRGQHPQAELLFEPLTRVIRVKDLSTAEFLLPYLVLHVLLGPSSSEAERSEVLRELTSILENETPENATYFEKEDVRKYCHAVFRILDYAMRWIHAKRCSGRLSSAAKESVARIQDILDSIPAEIISKRAADCNEYARALFHLEQHAQKMEQQKREPGSRDRLFERLQEIYANIDEPDGLEGISAHLQSLDINQQILSHKKAGRWSAAQTWYEMQLAEDPRNIETQIELLNCLKQGGQHDVLLNLVEGLQADSSQYNKIVPFAVEAAWVTGRWESMIKFKDRFEDPSAQEFNVSLASLFGSLFYKKNSDILLNELQQMREKLSTAMTSSATTSLQAAHDIMLKCHALTDLDILISMPHGDFHRKETLSLLDNRLQVIGAYYNDKQYLLGIRRAAMELLRPAFTDDNISSLWLLSARLARKTHAIHQSFNAILHASRLGDDAATIENAKLLWKDSHHRKAIQMLQGAIEQKKFLTQASGSASSVPHKLNDHQRLLTARAQLLLAKWLDAAGQTHASALREKYQQPPRTLVGWEKGHYYLGRHYKKILEAEQPLKVDIQSDNYLTGEIARLVIENYLRSLNVGTKYLYQTLPRALTLWLDLGANLDKAPEGKATVSTELYRRRVEQLNLLHTFWDKYIQRLPSFVFYSALPQVVARIAHPSASVFERLTRIIVRVVESYPRQALWSLIGVVTTRQGSERKARATQILQALRSISRQAEAEQLLFACHNGDFSGSNKAVHASLTRDLRFSHKCTPCPLVVPVESTLTAVLPAVSENMKSHRAFSTDAVSIQSFLDDVLVLSSLAKPRRLTARGTDGKNYMLLIKPKDDLRTDQRLMEFNGIINRSLKHDAESSRRQLYIRTYAVVPLNEECGIIEWVPGIRTMREILLGLYSSHKIHPDYTALKLLMDEASASESKIRIFTDDVLGRFPPLLPLWFIQQFPNPSAWFTARLRYTRSCAVMSMVGTILGLGDRHGENVNLEEGNGGIFHVDFNCLFEKGLTFAKPERVPFRLTHNMIAAMGIYGYEGPFRKSSELTLRILRQQEETLMTVLEAFIYDPTLDLQKKKKTSRQSDVVVKLQPQSVVDNIKRKVKGLLPNETIPLSIEGQVEELIKQAIDPRNLTSMYIGWCPFL